MPLKSQIRRLLVDSPNSLGGRARAKRWTTLLTCFPDFEDLRVVDLGGTVSSWTVAPVRPAHVTVLNLTEPGETTENWITPLMGDACDARTVLAHHLGHEPPFDLVYSNAVIEHVGGHASRERFATQARSLASRHWVQSPYRYFPVEPHWLFPGMQFLPLAAKAQIARYWPLAHSRATSLADARNGVQWTELLSITEMRAYFPESTIVHERIGGITKSIIAVRA